MCKLKVKVVRSGSVKPSHPKRDTKPGLVYSWRRVSKVLTRAVPSVGDVFQVPVEPKHFLVEFHAIFELILAQFLRFQRGVRLAREERALLVDEAGS
jgi:hypothetical protein